MAISEKKKASNAKWDSENMATLGCRLRKEHAVAFKNYCTERGLTTNTVLKGFVLDCIGEQEDRTVSPQTAPERALAGVQPISTETIKAVQSAAEATGESVPAYLARAVRDTAQRDNMALKMGINPTTGKPMVRDGQEEQRGD